jgi:YVTN family beta-propeller protein
MAPLVVGFLMLRRVAFLAFVAGLTAVCPVSAGSSNSLLDVSPDSRRLLAANADNDSVTVIDTASATALREIAVGRKPECVAWIGQGPRAAATLYVGRQVVIFDTETGAIVHRIPVAAEPYGIVADKDGKRAWVSHEYPGVVSEIDLEAGKVVREIPAGKMIRGIALAPDEKRVYVTEFYTGVLNAIDLAKGVIVDSWKGRSTDNLARHVVLHPKRPKAYVAHQRSIIKVNDGDGSIFPQLSVFDLKPGEENRRVSFAMDTFNGVYVVTNPWETAISPDGQRLYCIYAGTNDMNFCRVVDDDYSEMERIGGAVRLGQNPRAIRVSPDNKAVYVYNALEFAVAVHDPATMRLIKKIKTCEPPKSADWVRGKVLFNSSQPPMSARRWIACSSCHPDGHTDARVWQQPEGLRKTTALFGVAHTHPLHWSADRDEVQDFEFTIRSKLMRGDGLIPGKKFPTKVGFHKVELETKTSGKSKDLDALAIYTNSFDFELSPHADSGKLSAAALRGKELFFDKSVGCASCHSGPYFSDSSLTKPYKLHDIGTGNDDKSERMGTEYDTPTLLGIYRTAPYLHHGKAQTLHEVLTKYNAQDKHGKTSHLDATKVDDLVAFLKALPYEAPPEMTPNTVPYRFIPENKK